MSLHRTRSLRRAGVLRCAARLVLLGLALAPAACSSGESASTGSGGKGGGAEAGSGGKSGSLEAGSPATGGSGGNVNGGMGLGGTGLGGTGGNDDTMGTGGDEAAGYANPALLQLSGKATVSATEYAGTEEYHIVGESGLGSDVCNVQFDVNRVGEAPADCPDCDWSHLVELSNPQVLVDENGACSANDCQPLAAGVSNIAGSQVALGFSKDTGHGDQLMHYDDAKAMWVPLGRGNWDEPSSSLGYTISGSLCTYGN